MLKNKLGKSLLVFLVFVLMLTMSFFAYGDNVLGKGRISQIETQKNSQATNLGLYGSTTWDIVKDPTSNYVYIATKSPNGFFKSADTGLTWSGLPSDADYGQGNDVEVSPTTGYVYALLNSLIVSIDHGATFTEVDSFGNSVSGDSLLYAQNRLFVGLSNGTVNVSTDDGANFVNYAVSADNNVISLANYGTTLYALCQKRYSSDAPKLFASIDQGVTWTDLNISASSVIDVENVYVNPSNGYIFLVPGTEGTTTYRSVNSGASFSTLGSTTPVTSYMSFNSTGRIYVGNKYSDDNGNSWTIYNNTVNYGYIVIVDPTNDNILYGGARPGFQKSIDTGTTFTSYVEGITAVTASSISQAKDKNIVWVATQNGLAKTTDFLAETPIWLYPITPGDSSFSSTGKDSVWVNPEDPNIVVTGNSSAIYYSSDGGTSWSLATTDISLIGMVAHEITSSLNYKTLYTAVGRSAGLGTDGGVLKSIDNGATWTSMSFPQNGATLSITVSDDKDIFVGAGSGTGTVRGIYKYKNGSWEKMGAPNLEYTAVLTDPVDPDVVYALAVKTPSNSKVGFYKSIDDGVTFEHIKKGLENAYEFGAMTIQKSTTPHTIYISASDESKAKIYKSSDAGESWSVLYSGKKSENIQALLFDGLIAGNDRGLYGLKSKASLTLKTNKKKVTKGTEVLMTLILKDKATKKKLKNKKVTIMKKLKKNKKFKKFKTVKTDEKGKVNFYVTVKAKKKLFLKAKWTPKKKAKQEYAVAKSKQVKIKIRK